MELSGNRVTLALAGTDNFLHVDRDDFVISLRTFEGGIERAYDTGCISPAYTVMKSSSEVLPPYYHYLLKSHSFISGLQTTVTGIRDGKTVRFDNFADLILPVPARKDQQAIADFLDYETARIDQLIEKKKRLVALASSYVESLVDRAISDSSLPRKRFEYLTRRMTRPVDLNNHDELVRLGLYNRGRGIFKKPAADEEGMGASDFHFIKSGDLIISGQFAWEGAVAMATDDEEGCVVSHRYPVFRATDSIKTAYLLGFLRTKLGDFLLNDCSRGSAGRNRPLNAWRLGKEKIPVPSIALQEEVERAVVAHRKIKIKTEESIEKLNEFRSALITAAVTGQIDVNKWSRRGHSDAKLDAIAKEMEA
ncbi:restriction endonuclease subunit S [Ruficoccus sp. ZRK36]|uniref:restriction endonuclease subunit S n=1 Tax=Ruficoccus sp. ZRK36 TaxID=2866311 RepID=UPI001C72D12C|nr:restriction endonuclease subunit S [Ruficoccus sp. ZRK36]QYY37424.1 restriction endonuclease subunit S [Ruficoccus sp. ZRK36]